MTIDEFTTMIADELGVDVNDVDVVFNGTNITVKVINVDEDVFEEDQDFSDDGDE